MHRNYQAQWDNPKADHIGFITYRVMLIMAGYNAYWFGLIVDFMRYRMEFRSYGNI